jgi:catalase
MAQRLLFIALVVLVVGGLLAYTGGLFTADRLTPELFLTRFGPPGGLAPGHRRNHAKGICFKGDFAANGAGTALSRAAVFTSGHYPVVGRFNLGDPDPKASDATTGVRGLGIRITTPDGRQWRSAMINAPQFPVATPQAFFELLGLRTSTDPQAMAHFAAAHPEFAAFGAIAAQAKHTASFTEEQYNSINAFIFTDGSGHQHAVRWSVQSADPAETKTPDELKAMGPDFLFPELRKRLAAAPLRFPLNVTVAAPGDPTADPSKPWPADRQHVEVGVITVQEIEDEADGPCRDINYDPTVLPDGISVSDDPFPAARSAVYAKSFDRRTAEEADYPHTSAPVSP